MGSLERIKEAVVVTPSEQTPTGVLPLSAIDSQLFLRFTIEYLLVYKPQPGSDPGSVSARVKSALAKALVPYYPLAGRVRQRPDGSGLEVSCRAQGALFIEAMSERAVPDFGHAPRRVVALRGLLSVTVTDVLKGAPALVVQLTRLRDGGYALGVGINHCVCDGVGSAAFLNLFAGLALGKRESPVENIPVWDRHLMDATSSSAVVIDLPEFSPAPDLCNFMSRFSPERLTPTSFTFSKRCLTELKVKAVEPFTAFEVLTAHVWRSWVCALGLPAGQTVKVLFSVNVRERVRPSLPEGYYGNAFVLGCAVSTVRELSESGLGQVAGLVKAAKERIGDEHVRAVTEHVAGGGRACPDPVGVLIVSQWSRLGLERVDFGLGVPVHVGPVLSDRYCLFLPVAGQRDAVKVMVAVPTGAAEKYLECLAVRRSSRRT